MELSSGPKILKKTYNSSAFAWLVGWLGWRCRQPTQRPPAEAKNIKNYLGARKRIPPEKTNGGWNCPILAARPRTTYGASFKEKTRNRGASDVNAGISETPARLRTPRSRLRTPTRGSRAGYNEAALFQPDPFSPEKSQLGR